MTADEVIWFINHKYGEQAALDETSDLIKIYTGKSTWLIHKHDYEKFGRYELFHANQTTHIGYHRQMYGYTIPYLVYCAVMHDYPPIFSTRKTWDEFQNMWDLYQLGQSLWKSVCEWDEVCGYEAYINGEYD